MPTYPTPCKKSPLARGLFEKLSSAASFVKLTQKGKNVAADVEDALYCAIVAYLFCRQPETLLPPSRRAPLEEGWIWVPKDCLKTEGEGEGEGR